MESVLRLDSRIDGEAAADPDVALFASASSGDAEALAALYDRFGRELYGYALWRTGAAEAAEDSVQELFCRLASGAASTARPVRSPKAWLFTVLRRAAIDVERRRRREVPLEEASALTLVAPTFGQLELAVDTARAARALARLPPRLREALYLRYWAELGYREIGRVTRVPTFTAASRCRLALARLRRLLEPQAGR